MMPTSRVCQDLHDQTPLGALSYGSLLSCNAFAVVPAKAMFLQQYI